MTGACTMLGAKKFAPCAESVGNDQIRRKNGQCDDVTQMTVLRRTVLLLDITRHYLVAYDV